MIKPVLRILALFALAMALITAVLDITRSIADSTLIITPMGIDWLTLSPGTLTQAQTAVSTYLFPALWDPVIQTILLAPSWFIFGALWLILSLLGKRSKGNWQRDFG